MNRYVFRTLDGGTTGLDAATIDAFAGGLRGDAVAADHPDYDQARAVWNGTVDRHPTLIARCRGARDIQNAVRLAAEHGLLVSVRGGSRPERDDAVRDWARQTFSAAAPHGTGGGYVNFLTEDEAERTQAAYGVNYARLQAVKQRVDPRNLFRMNLNVPPQVRDVAA